MEKSKGSEPRDRLSELSDSLIHHILSFLPMRDVVRTTLLSNRWKDLWTSVPCLNFESNAKAFLDFFRSFVNGALILWRGTKILKFDLDFVFREFCTRDLDLWLRFAMEKGVEELSINLLDHADEFTYMDGHYFPPRRLFYCSSLRKLSLSGCSLRVKGNVQWNQLKSLRISGVRLCEHVINELVAGSPQLEVLDLNLLEGSENVNIRSSSLKTLTIEKNIDMDNVDVHSAMRTTLSVWAPNVETLEIRGIMYGKCLLMNISSTASADVLFIVPECYEYDRFSCYQLFEEMLGLVCQSTRYVEEVMLSDLYIKVLGEMKEKKKDTLAPLSTAESLKLYASEANGIVGVVEIFPQMTMLVVEYSCAVVNEDKRNHCFEILCDTIEPFVSKFDDENSMDSKTDLITPHLLHLKRVEITWVAHDNSIFSVIEILLKIASKLEKLVFRFTEISSPVPPEALFLAAQKMLSVQRSFPTVEVIMCKD